MTVYTEWVPRTLKLQALPHQMMFWRDFVSERRLGLIGPLGTGKTRSLVVKDMLLHLFNHQHMMKRGERGPLRNMILAPTYTFISDVIIPTAEQVLEAELGIEIKIRRGQSPRIDYPRSFGYAQTLLRSGEKPSRLVGSNLCAVGVDEPGLIQDEAFKKAFARVRDPRAKVRQRYVCGTPEGVTGYFFDKFSTAKPPYRAIRGRTWHPDIKNYPLQIREEFAGDEAYIASYLRAEFVPLLAGRSFRAFVEEIHMRKVEPKPRWPLILSCDFNVDHMSWTVSQSTQEDVWTFDEIRLGANRQTEDAATEFADRYAADYGMYPLTITGDSSGEARSTSGPVDYDTIKEVLRKRGFQRIRFDIPKANPRVKDRVDNANYHLSGRGVRITIDPKCEALRTDLLSVTWADNGRDFDKRNKKLTHMSDAWSYMLWRMFPQWTVRRRRETPLIASVPQMSGNLATESF